MSNKLRYIFIIFSLFLFLIFIFPLMSSLLLKSSDLSSTKLEINKTIKNTFLNDIDTDTVVLFFGYVGCVDICTPILQDLATMYESKEIKPIQDRFKVVFVNLTFQVDPLQPKYFAQFFHKKFEGIYLSQNELHNIDRVFSLYYSTSLLNDLEVNHTDNIYLLKRNKDIWILKSIYFSNNGYLKLKKDLIAN